MHVGLPCRLSMCSRPPLFLPFLAPACERFRVAGVRPSASSTAHANGRFPGDGRADGFGQCRFRSRRAEVFGTNKFVYVDRVKAYTFIPLRDEPGLTSFYKDSENYNYSRTPLLLGSPLRMTAAELLIARKKISQVKEDAAWLDRLSKKGMVGRRLPGNAIGAVESALRAMERNIGRLQEEIEMFSDDIMRLGHYRLAVRRLYQFGKRPEKVLRAIRRVGVAGRHAVIQQAVVYLSLNRGLHRAAVRILESVLRHLNNLEAEEAWKGAIRVSPLQALVHIVIMEMLEGEIDVNTPNSRRSMRLLMLLSDDVTIGQIVHYMVVLRAPLDTLHSFYVKWRTNLSPNTSFHIIDRLCSVPAYWRQAFDILKDLHQRGKFLSTPQSIRAHYRVFYQALCAEDEESSDILLQLMMSVGLSAHVSRGPDVNVYNMLMAKAAHALDFESVFRFYDKLKSEHAPTQTTLLILHYSFKLLGNERDRVEVLREATRLFDLNKWFATDALHASVVNHVRYRHVLHQYCTYFESSILQALGIAQLNSYEHWIPKLMRPDEVTLAIMVTSFCRTSTFANSIWHLYEKYRAIMLDRTHRDFSVIRRTGCSLQNIMLLALGERGGGLPFAARIMEDLLAQGSKTPPDSFTWNIFLRGLTRQGRVTEADRVVGMMKARGVEPDEVTYNTILDGYLRLNAARGAGRVLGKMMQQGHGVSAWTARSVGRVGGKQEEEFLAGMDDAAGVRAGQVLQMANREKMKEFVNELGSWLEDVDPGCDQYRRMRNVMEFIDMRLEGKGEGGVRW